MPFGCKSDGLYHLPSFACTNGSPAAFLGANGLSTALAPASGVPLSLTLSAGYHLPSLANTNGFFASAVAFVPSFKDPSAFTLLGS